MTSYVTAGPPATTVDLDVPSNGASSFLFVYCNPIPGTNPPLPDPTSPITVTGYTARLQMRTNRRGGHLLLDLANGTGITVGGANGQFAVAVTSAEARGIVQNGVYDLLVTPSAGDAIRIAQGSIIADLGVTLP